MNHAPPAKRRDVTFSTAFATASAGVARDAATIRSWASGSATVNVVFPREHVTLTGPLSHFVSQADSGNRMIRGFCATCGTPVTSV